MDYPKDSDMMEVFECQKTQTNKYVALIFTYNNHTVNGVHSFLVMALTCVYVQVQAAFVEAVHKGFESVD